MNKYLLLLISILGLSMSQAFTFSIDYTAFEKDIYWQKLMHYQPSIRGLHGQADGAGYYFSTNGAWSLAEEAKASVLAFMTEVGSDPNYHPQCRFPERFRYLKEKLALEIKAIFCPDYIEWMNSLDPVGAALVFASNYPNNPGSAMGHTFIRIISRKTSRLQKGWVSDNHLDLLDYSISYAASTDEVKGFKYAMSGLFGGFYGQFSMQPYYMKVREYNEGEGRDLWEYELNINEASVKKMVANFWEVSKNTHFNYFFIDENCSFHMLTMLDIAKPEWNLSSHFPLFTIPYETIKALAKIPDAILETKYRASLPKRSQNISNQLTTQERSDFKAIIEGRVPLLKYSSNAPFLEAFATYIHYQKIENEMIYPSGMEALYNESLITRAKLGKSKSPTRKIEPPISARPEIGHSASQVSLNTGFLDGKQIQNFNFKIGLHDLINREAGFSADTRLNFLGLNLKRFKGKNQYKYKIDEILIVDTLSLIAVTEYEKPKSWGIRAAYHTPEDQELLARQTLQVLPSIGLNFKPWANSVSLYVLGQWEFEYAYFTKSNLRTGPGAAFGTVMDIGSKSKLNIEGRLNKNLMFEDNSFIHGTINLGYAYFLLQDLELRLHIREYFNSPFKNDKLLGKNYFKWLIGGAYTF